MDNKLSIQTTTKLLKLRGILDQVGQVSWAFSILNKQNPIQQLSEKDALQLLKSYDDLIKKVINSIKYEYGGFERGSDNMGS